MNLKLVLFGIGFITLTFQTIFIREFLLLTGISELFLGLFLGLWLLWIGIGALLPFPKKFEYKKFRVSLWFYVVAGFIVFGIIRFYPILIHKGLTIKFSLYDVVLLAGISSLPISLFTGRIFVLINKNFKSSVASLYAFEVIGSIIGSIYVMLMFRCSYSSFQILIIGIGIYILFILSSNYLRWVFIVLILIGFVNKIGDLLELKLWNVLLKTIDKKIKTKEILYTPYNTLIFCKKGKKNIILENNKITYTPSMKKNYKTEAAFLLSIIEGPHDILLSGFTPILVNILSSQDVKLTFVERDKTKIKFYKGILHNWESSKIKVVNSDILQYLNNTSSKFDIIALNYPVKLLKHNRYYTPIFYRKLSSHLKENGALIIRIGEIANYLSPHIKYLIGSILNTIKSSFSYTLIIPSNPIRILASNKKIRIGQKILESNFKSNKISLEIDPKIFFSYLQLSRINETSYYWEKKAPVNTMRNLEVSFTSIILTLKKSSLKIANAYFNLKKTLSKRFLFLILIISLLFLLFFMKSHNIISYPLLFTGGISFVGFCNGLVSILFYQAIKGDIYSNLGFLSAIFMSGIFLGVLCSSYIKRNSSISIIIYLLLYAGVTTFNVCFLPFQYTLSYVGMLLGIGFFIGSGIGIVANLYNNNLIPAIIIEFSDHVGAFLGAFVCSILILPLVGVNGVFIINIAIFIILLVLTIKFNTQNWLKFNLSLALKNLLYITIITISAIVIVCSWKSNVKTSFSINSIKKHLPLKVKVERVKINSLQYYILRKDGKVWGYMFISSEMNVHVKGFGGEMELLIITDPKLNIRKIKILNIKETPSYIPLIERFVEKLQKIHDSQKILSNKVDVISGATISCNAIIETIKKTISQFKNKILTSTSLNNTSHFPRWGDLILYFVVIIGIISYFIPNKYFFWIGSVASIVFIGFIYHYSFSLYHLILFLKGSFLDSSRYVMIWIATVLFVSLLLPSFYCARICPFGMLQEMLRVIVKITKFRIKNDSSLRLIKYIVYIVFLFACIIGPLGSIGYLDIFINFFNTFSLKGVIIGIFFLVIGIFIPRFYCRYFCVVGGFLRVIGELGIPRKCEIEKCEYGLSKYDVDCLKCGLYSKSKKYLYVEKWIKLLIFIIWLYILNSLYQQNLPKYNIIKKFSHSSSIKRRSSFTPIDVNLYKRLIKEGRLSNKKALYWEKYEDK